MKEEKKSYYIIKIMELLLDGNVLTIDAISTQIKVSEKTTRTKINEINDFLRKNDLGEILKKPRIGVWYSCTMDQQEKTKSIMYNVEQVKSINFGNILSNDERLFKVLTYIFKNRKKEIITSQKLGSVLFLSTPTILKILKDCELWFRKYGIILENHRTKGIVIYFDENSYRRAVQQLILQASGVKNIEKNIINLLPGIRYESIKKTILKSETEWNFEFVDESFYEILVYCCVAASRGNRGTIVIEDEDIETLKRYNEYLFAKTIMQYLTSECSINFSDNEIYLLAIQILCAKFMEKDFELGYRDAVKVYDDKLIQFTDEMISMSSNILGVDLKDDNILKESLVIHLRSTLFRMKYSSLATNTLIYYIKKQYKHVFRAMWGLSILFERYFDCNITEDELGFICLYFQAALERKKTKMYQILIVSTHSRSTNQLIVHKILKVGAGMVSVDVVGVHDFKIKCYDKYDLIYTTDDLGIKDSRVKELKDIISNDWINELYSYFNQYNMEEKSVVYTFDVECHQLFDPDLICLNIECNTKEEILELLSSKLQKKGMVTKQFFETVMLREGVTSTDIGNGIALPHGDQRLVNQAKVAIAILKKPILWNQEEVDIVFLLAMKMETKDEVSRAQKFYKQYIRLIETEEKLQLLKGFETNIDLYNYLIR